MMKKYVREAMYEDNETVVQGTFEVIDDGQAEDEVRQDYDDMDYDVCRPVVRAVSRWKTT